MLSVNYYTVNFGWWEYLGKDILIVNLFNLF